MTEVRTLPEFDEWLSRLRDIADKVRIIKRIERAAHGNLGDVAPVGDGVFEMRLFFGPGYRLYFVQRDGAMIVLLCGGDKSTQAADIARARNLAKEID